MFRTHIVRYLVSVIARVYSTVHVLHALPHTEIGVGPRESVKTQVTTRAGALDPLTRSRSFDKGPALDELRLQRLEVLTRRVHLRLRIG